MAEASVATLAFGLLATALMYPLFSDLATSTLDADRNWIQGFGPGFERAIQRDINLFVWIYAWDWHALTTNPSAWFDANIFYPAPNALAYSEHALGKLLITGPLYALSGNPIFAYQADLLACFALSGGAMFFALRRFGLHPAAAFLAGFVYAFGPARIESLYHTYLLAGQFLPVLLLALDRTLFEARLRTAVWLAVLLLLQLLCSYYTAYMTVFALAAYGLALLIVGRNTFSSRGLALVVAAAAVALGLFVVPSLPYLRIRTSGAVPTYDATVLASGLAAFSNGLWQNYFVPLHVIRAGWATVGNGSYAYLGIVPILLALYGLGRRETREATRRLRAGAVAITVVAWLMALGPEMPVGDGWPGPYAAAMWLVPGFSSMRVPSRFALMVLTGVALLAGIGADAVFRHRRFLVRPLATTVVGALLVGVVAIDYGYGTERFDTKPFAYPGNDPDVYRFLARQPPGPVLEWPPTDRVGLRTSEYMVRSTLHWNPILNGVSGYGPPSHQMVMRLSNRLPAPAPLELLGRMTGLRYVIVHTAEIAPLAKWAWKDPAGLELVRSFGGDRLYRVIDPPSPDLRPALVECARSGSGCEELRELARAAIRGGARPRS